MKIDTHLPLEALNERLREGAESAQISFQASPIVDITLTRTLGGILVKGIVSGPCLQDCSSCAEPVPHEVTASIDWILQTPADRAGPEDELDDPGVIVYEGDHVELEEHLQEALILSLSPFWHPPRDSQDRCTHCKRDCSVKSWGSSSETPTSPFGTLLKGALSGGKK